MDKSERQYLLQKIAQLEEKVSQLRVSRRVLIQLVERVEHEKSSLIEKMERERKNLKKQNAKYARIILEHNKQLYKFQEK